MRRRIPIVIVTLLVATAWITPAGQRATRIGDMHFCPMVYWMVPHVGGPIATGSPTVIICGMPAARQGDTALCAGPADFVAQGSATVLINGLSAARVGDPTVHGGGLVAGCPTVHIGG